MRGVLLYLILIILLACYAYASPYPQVTGNSLLDARATATTGLSIVVNSDSIAPNITIYYPTTFNNTGNTSIPLRVKFSDNNALGTAYFNVNNGTNTTLALNSTNGSSTTFNTSMGYNVLYIYVNDTANNQNSSSRSFYTTYNFSFALYFQKANHSNTINLSNLDNATLDKLTNFSIESSSGKINFTATVNLTQIPSQNIDVELYDHLNITNNFIFLNSTRLRGLNVTAILSFYNLNFINPRVLRDGVTCPATFCSNQTYSGGNLTFAVTGFSSYLAEETPDSGSGSDGETARTGEGAIKGPRKPTREAEELPPAAVNEFGPERKPTFIERIVKRFTGKKEEIPVKTEEKPAIVEYPSEVTIPLRNLLSAIMTMAIIVALFVFYQVIRDKLRAKFA